MTYEEAQKIYSSPAYQNMSGDAKAQVDAALSTGGKALETTNTVAATPVAPAQSGLGQYIIDKKNATAQQRAGQSGLKNAVQTVTGGLSNLGTSIANGAKQAWEGSYSQQNPATPPASTPAQPAQPEQKQAVVQSNQQNLDNQSDEGVASDVQEAIQTQVPEENKSTAYKQTRSVWQAWKDGEFGNPDSKDAKSARNYFLLDSLASFASSQAAQAAQLANIYRGGTADVSAYNNPQSKWAQQQSARQEQELSNELSSSAAVNEAETNEQIANSFKSSPQATQALQNLILQAQANATPDQLQAQIENMRKAGELSDAQVAYLNQQVNWFDTNQALGALKTIAGILH